MDETEIRNALIATLLATVLILVHCYNRISDLETLTQCHCTQN
jgi:hypothetical protein